MKLKKARMEERFNAAYPEDLLYEEKYHVSAFERPNLPILTSNNTSNFQLMSWGLIPSWIKSEKDAVEISLKTMNARADTIHDKPSFKHAAKANRCIIPVTGFFEWQQVGTKKIPWFIFYKDQDAFSFAGIWSEWTNPNSGEIKKSFTIITTEANELMSNIHNTKKRMPAILTPENEKKWLDQTTKQNEYSNLIKPLEDGVLEAYTISPLVSNTHKNRNIPEVLEKYVYSNERLF